MNILKLVQISEIIIIIRIMYPTASRSALLKRHRWGDQQRHSNHNHEFSSVCTNHRWLLFLVCLILFSKGAANDIKTTIDVDSIDSSDTNDVVDKVRSKSSIVISDKQDENPTKASAQSKSHEYSVNVDGTVENILQATETNNITNEQYSTNNEVRKDDEDYSGVPFGCKLVMAPSTILNSGWGIFTVVDRQPGTPIIDGDVVIQVTDFNESNSDATTLQRFQDYYTSSEETGGYYEAVRVLSALPGIGMLANGLPDKQHNVLPYVPTVDEGGLVRTDSPGAGAISHYHNYTYYALRPISAGSELFLKVEHEKLNRYQSDNIQSSSTNINNATRQHTVQWLMRYGRCIDNLKPDKSKQPNAGRGVFAKRFIPMNGIVAPVPLLVINNRTSMDITTIRTDKSITQTRQLLINYCFGHPKSSLLFFPYSPMVNLINHGGGKNTNVQLRWSTSNVLHETGLKWLKRNITIDELLQQNNTNGTLLFDLVATKPIRTGDEILLDYGIDWINAWVKHVTSWTPANDADSYAPAYVQDDVIQTLRTESELSSYPYPDNVITSCFYKYSDNKQQAEQSFTTTSASSSKNEVPAFIWNMTRGTFDLSSLRPCSIIKRSNDSGNKNDKTSKGTLFTVRIQNRNGLLASELIPKGMVHIVKNVPRYAIRLTDKLYSTDQHLVNTFRHAIGIPDDIFPSQWKHFQ